MCLRVWCVRAIVLVEAEVEMKVNDYAALVCASRYSMRTCEVARFSGA